MSAEFDVRPSRKGCEAGSAERVGNVRVSCSLSLATQQIVADELSAVERHTRQDLVMGAQAI
ncbi:MAG: hypothetical protein WA988_11590 [Candidatus Nanopelagicales bacterium]